MSEIIRQDLFDLSVSDFHVTGFFTLRKGEADNPTAFLEQILVLPSNSKRLDVLPVGVVGQIRQNELFNAIVDGDIATINNRGQIRVVLSSKANHNTLLLTERCDNRCLFCSQPPKDIDDSWLLSQAAMAMAAFNHNGTIGLSGGEPLLYGEAFLRLLDFVIEHCPTTSLHVLTNGRAFSNKHFAEAVAKRAESLPISFGIPLYASRAEVHDHLVGTNGAFKETVIGLLNAGNLGISIELRFIPTRENIDEMVATTEFVTRVLSNVSQISIMNLEATGWAKKNWGDLYLTPDSYQNTLEAAVTQAERAGLPVLLFNYPLCHLSEQLRPFTVKSISDWKNYYPDECNGCKLKGICSGFFASSQGRFHQKPRRLI